MPRKKQQPQKEEKGIEIDNRWWAVVAVLVALGAAAILWPKPTSVSPEETVLEASPSASVEADLTVTPSVTLIDVE